MGAQQFADGRLRRITNSSPASIDNADVGSGTTVSVTGIEAVFQANEPILNVEFAEGVIDSIGNRIPFSIH